MLRASVGLLDALVAAHSSGDPSFQAAAEAPRRGVPHLCVDAALSTEEEARDARSRLSTLMSEVERYCREWSEVRPLRRVEQLREVLCGPTAP